MNGPLPTLALNLDPPFLEAALPLLEAGEVHAAEWSFDSHLRHPNYPAWFEGLLAEFSKADRLIGHGIFFSLFTAEWSLAQSNWLAQLADKAERFTFQHVTEHFGFMSGPDFHKGAPLPVPFTDEFLAIGQDRLLRIAQAAQCPVGLENLAFSYSSQAVKEQGSFLNALLEPVNGFLILDLHNLYCQLHNFELEFDELIQSYPLERVREIHISGGSWEPFPETKIKKVRRDTHDEAVPNEVFDLLERTLPLCPNLQYVVLEQMGFSLTTTAERAQFRADFRTMAAILQNHKAKPIQNHFELPDLAALSAPLEIPELYVQQMQLSQILEQANDANHARKLLDASILANTAWNHANWPNYMLQTAVDIAQKWKNGFG